MPPFIDPVEITDTGEIESIIQYMNSLHPGMRIFDNTRRGAAYYIEILYDDGATSNIYLIGNSSIRVDNNPEYSLPYDEASAFGTVIGNILINKYRAENVGTMIRGEVLSVSSEESGRNTACEVKTDDGTIVSVDLNTVKHIICITGAGWLILHVGDEVEIGLYDGFIADMVFITKSVMP